MSNLTREEQKLLAEVQKLVMDDDQLVNYETLKINAPEEASGEFWFRIAEAMSTLPPNRSLDLRVRGGRLVEAVSILSVLIQDNDRIPELWAQKITALNYLAHGHFIRANGLSQQPDKADQAQEEAYLSKAMSQNLLTTLESAIERFPEEQWFREMQADAWTHFGKDARQPEAQA